MLWCICVYTHFEQLLQWFDKTIVYLNLCAGTRRVRGTPLASLYQGFDNWQLAMRSLFLHERTLTKLVYFGKLVNAEFSAVPAYNPTLCLVLVDRAGHGA